MHLDYESAVGLTKAPDESLKIETKQLITMPQKCGEQKENCGKPERNVMKSFSFDAETNGLWGTAFAISAVVKDGDNVKEFLGRCPISETVNQWVAENVLPQMENVPVNYDSYEALLRGFFAFYMENKEGATIIVHMGLPVEARLFLDAHNMGIIGDWDAPYPLVDICALPAINTSVDGYNKANNLEVPMLDGGTHNPLYDSWAALVAYEHILG